MKTALAPHARDLRRRSTPAEAALWDLLRDRRLAGLKFRRQHAWRGFVLDFYCASARLVIGVDGATHDEASQRVRDDERTAVLHECGVEVLRFLNREVLDHPETVVARILGCIRAAPSPLTPALSPTRGEGDKKRSTKG